MNRSYFWKSLSLVAFLAIFASCSSPTSIATSPDMTLVQDRRWILESYVLASGTPGVPPADKSYWFRMKSDSNQWTERSGCNSVEGFYAIHGNDVLDSGLTTLVYCAFTSEFSSALCRFTVLGVDSTKLRISSPAPSPVRSLTFLVQ